MIGKERLFKSGLVLGKFFPFHLGHKYLIDSALEECDCVKVVVCHNKTQSISGSLRIGAIKETYRNNKRVIVYSLEDDGMPQSDSESPSIDEFYKIWIPPIKDLVGYIDSVFTSEDYGEGFGKYLGVYHVLVDKERIKFPVSGTVIRKDPMENWDFISDSIKNIFVRKVAVVGPESVGKTTLVQNISTHFQTNFLPEYGRLVSENKPELEIDDFYQISKGRQELEDWLIKYSNKVLICDTEDIVTYTFSKMYCPKNHYKYENYFIDKINRSNYDIYILLKPNCDPVQDGTRKFLDDRLSHYNEIKYNLDRFNKNYIEIGGSWEDRYTLSKNAINNLIYTKNKNING